MTPHLRTRTTLALGVTAVLLTGCGGKPAAPAPTGPVPLAQTAVGGYRLSTVISDSTITANQAGPSSRVSTDLFLTCADAGCTQLLQRAASTGRPQGATVLLSPGPGGFTGTHVRAGECGGGIDGSFGESYSWTWSVHDDGSLTGALHQVFKGCGLDGTTTFEATATPEKTLKTPYLPKAAARALIAALNSYDTELSKVYVSGSECNTAPDTTTVHEAACFARTYAAWRPDIDLLGSRTAKITGATGACASALKAVTYEPWSRAVGDAATIYGAAHGPKGIKAGITAENVATSTADTEHDRLITVAAMCTDPADAAELGKNGDLQLDPTSVLQPLAG